MSKGYSGKIFTDLVDLCEFTKMDSKVLLNCALNMDKNVRIIVIKKKDGSNRQIYAPSKKLKNIQKKIKNQFFNNFEYPNYVFGIGATTLLNHASQHKGNKELIQTDLTDFFPSINYKKVYKMWIADFHVSPSIARILTKLTTYDGALQQGFPTSSHIAACVAIDYTKRLDEYCRQKNIVFTQYVDDLNYSAEKIDKKSLFKYSIESARKSGFSVKKRKTKSVNKDTGKKITGVSLFKERTRAPRDVRQRAVRALKELEQNPKNKQLTRVVNGYARFLNHLNMNDGEKYRKHIKKIIDKP